MAHFRILSVDGGGTRGIIPATILHCIYKVTGKHPTEIFPLLAGTSTGGILCTGLAYGLSTQEMIDLYLKQSKQIFYDTGWDNFRDGFGKNLGADYSTKRFRTIVNRLFGKSTLYDIYKKYNGNVDLMVCSFDLNPIKDGKPVNFRPKVFHSDFIKDMNTKLSDLCLMTSAGPTYFPIYDHKYIDGGVSLNNPAMAALSYAINDSSSMIKEYRHQDGVRRGLGKDMSELKIFSLGCGTSNANRISKEVIKENNDGDWGNIQWIKYLPDLLTESNVQAADYYVEQLIGSRYKRIQIYFDQPDIPQILKQKQPGIDVKDPKLLQAMHEYTVEYCDQEMDNILDFLALTDS